MWKASINFDFYWFWKLFGIQQIDFYPETKLHMLTCMYSMQLLNVFMMDGFSQTIFFFMHSHDFYLHMSYKKLFIVI